MNIEYFIKKSLGEWKSMRSGHSLAFQQFEEVISTININSVSTENPEVLSLIKSNGYTNKQIYCPFKIDWASNSNWEENNEKNLSSGSSVFIPIPLTEKTGLMIRSLGYSESMQASSNYTFLNDGTIILSTKYSKTNAEERIWFISNNVRCRSSVLRSSESAAILQTSHASEIRKINI